MSKSTENSILLDVDSSIMEKNLFVMPESEQDAAMQKLFPPSMMMPSKIVKPTPGLCIKSHTLEGKKLFINICQTDAIPAPTDINNTELLEILASDEPSNFRVPMSIGEPKDERDSNGKPVIVCDVAIHPKFFQKCEKEDIFKAFLIRICLEALDEKHKITSNPEKYAVLKNKKVFGTLQAHRIQNRDVAKAKQMQLGNQNDNKDEPQKKKPLIEVVADSPQRGIREPKYRILREPSTGKIEYLVGEFKLTGVASASEVSLDVGEDRIILDAKLRGYFLDIFIPHNIVQDDIAAQFNRHSSILTLTMPVAAPA